MNMILALLLLGAEAQIPGEAVTQTAPGTLGHRLAPWASLLVPGSGELLRGYKLKGEAFLWADGAALTGAVGFGWDAASKGSAARGMAVMNAGANSGNRSRTYLAALEEYLSSDDYNLEVAIDARRLYPNDFQEQQAYIAEHSFAGDDAWLWVSDSLRSEYVDQRARARKSEQACQAFIGIMVLARLASAFDVVFFSPQKESRLGVVPTWDHPGFRITCRF